MSSKDAGCIVAVACVAFSAGFASAAGEVVYENDFNTRSSVSAIPFYDVLKTANPYNIGSKTIHFCLRPSGSGYDADDLMTYFESSLYVYNDRAAYDGWFVPYFNSDYKLGMGTFYSGETNCFVWTYGSNTKRYGYALKSLHNAFTNGLLRLQVDMRAPTKWSNTSGTACFFPVYDKYMETLAWGGALPKGKETPGRVGFLSTTSSSGNFTRSYVHAFSGDGDTGNIGTFEAGSWLRYVVTFDLDAGTFSGSVYLLGTDLYPSFDTATPDTASVTFGPLQAWTAMSEDTGPITGIGFYGYGGFDDGIANNINKPMTDNIRVSWKAPSADDFTMCYEDDFVTRSYRTLCAEGASTISTAYAQSTEAKSIRDEYTYDTRDGVALGSWTIAPGPSGKTISSAQPIGIDGWRYVPYTSHNIGGASVVAYGGEGDDAGGKGGNMLTYGYNGEYSLLEQTLGKSYTSGKVRIVGDFRLPGMIGGKRREGFQRAGIGLGSLAMYSAAQATVADGLVAGCGSILGLSTTATENTPYVVTNAADSTVLSDEATEMLSLSNYWYRIEVTANLDTRTYDASITPLSSLSVAANFTPTNDVVYSKSGVAFASGSTDIGSFYIYGYGYGSAWNVNYIDKRVCVDNVMVYHTASGENTEKLVYENNFTTRTWHQPAIQRETGLLAHMQANRDDADNDHWVARDFLGWTGLGAWTTVRDDNGNQYVAMGRETEAGKYAMCRQEIGEPVTADRFCLSVDVRPPANWGVGDGSLEFAFGDPGMSQTEADESVYEAHRQIAFGFASKTDVDTTTSGCPYYFPGANSVAFLRTVDANGDKTVANLPIVGGVTEGNWYRLVAKVCRSSKTYSLAVYDMGSTHPEMGATSGTRVASLENQPFAADIDDDDGFGVISLYGKGMGGHAGSLGMDPDHILFDNVRIWTLNGLNIIIR